MSLLTYVIRLTLVDKLHDILTPNHINWVA